MTTTASLPGNEMPISMECDAPFPAVAGRLPEGLNGTLYRNGPNAQFAARGEMLQHLFLGDGMVHAFTLRGGRAAYRNRWVRTAKWLAENAKGRSLLGEGGGDVPDEGVANTNVVWHADRLLALEELHLPIELDRRTLATLGARDFGGRLRGPFTAHPKRDPLTGELVFFGYSATGPLSAGMSWGTLSADGEVTRFEYFEAPFCAMVHDFAVTEQHVIFPIFPIVGDLALAEKTPIPFLWTPERGTHLGIIDRAEGVRSLRWIETDPCYAYHVMNAWEFEGRLCVDLMPSAAPALFPRADGRESTAAETAARLTRWSLDPSGRSGLRSEVLDDTPGEFPRLDERSAGLRNRFGCFVAESGRTGVFDSIAWHDFRQARRHLFTLPAGDESSEAVFVPRGPQAEEGDGWLLAVVFRGAERRSDLIVLDTRGIADGPVATVQLSHRVPVGFHGNWVPAAS